MPKFVLFAVLFVPTVLMAEYSAGYPVPSASFGKGAAKLAARLPKDAPMGKIPRDLRGITHNDLGPQVAERLRNVSRDSDPFLYEMYRSIEIPMAEMKHHNEGKKHKTYSKTVLGGTVHNKFYSNFRFQSFGNGFLIEPKPGTFLSVREANTDTKTFFIVPIQKHNETIEITYNTITLRIAKARTYILGNKSSEKVYDFAWDHRGLPDHLSAAELTLSLNGEKVDDLTAAIEALAETYKKATKRELLLGVRNFSEFLSLK